MIRADSPVLLDVAGLTASIGEKKILKGLALTVRAGEVHAIMGPNGSGKSTLSYVLAGRPGYEVTAGSVTFQGRDLLALAAEERARAGVFLGFQYPVEIPGVSFVQFLRESLNAQRRARGETELSGGAFLQVAKVKAGLLKMDMDMLKRPVNVFDAPRIQSGNMYSAAQAYSAGHYALQEDEAMLIDLTLSGAAYAVVPITNVWGGIGDVFGRRAMMSTSGAQANADGSCSFILSPADPGIENWVDAGGQHTGIVFFRWIGLPASGAGFAPPALQTRIVKLAEVERKGADRVTPTQRSDMLARRAESYRRWQEGGVL